MADREIPCLDDREPPFPVLEFLAPKWRHVDRGVPRKLLVGPVAAPPGTEDEATPPHALQPVSGDALVYIGTAFEVVTLGLTIPFFGAVRHDLDWRIFIAAGSGPGGRPTGLPETGPGAGTRTSSERSCATQRAGGSCGRGDERVVSEGGPSASVLVGYTPARRDARPRVARLEVFDGDRRVAAARKLILVPAMEIVLTSASRPDGALEVVAAVANAAGEARIAWAVLPEESPLPEWQANGARLVLSPSLTGGAPLRARVLAYATDDAGGVAFTGISVRPAPTVAR